MQVVCPSVRSIVLRSISILSYVLLFCVSATTYAFTTGKNIGANQGIEYLRSDGRSGVTYVIDDNNFQFSATLARNNKYAIYLLHGRPIMMTYAGVRRSSHTTAVAPYAGTTSPYGGFTFSKSALYRVIGLTQDDWETQGGVRVIPACSMAGTGVGLGVDHVDIDSLHPYFVSTIRSKNSGQNRDAADDAQIMTALTGAIAPADMAISAPVETPFQFQNIVSPPPGSSTQHAHLARAATPASSYFSYAQNIIDGSLPQWEDPNRTTDSFYFKCYVVFVPASAIQLD